MIELRLCNIEGARWLEQLRLRPGEEVVTAPKEFGLQFHRRVLRRLKDFPTVAQLTTSPVEGLVLAHGGVEFYSADLIGSVAHALAAGAVDKAGVEQKDAYKIENFVDGQDPYSVVPALLASAGVYSCMAKKTALELSEWIHDVDKTAYLEQVDDMFGDEAVDVYTRVARALQVTLSSVSIHDTDICCWRPPSTMG